METGVKPLGAHKAQNSGLLSCLQIAHSLDQMSSSMSSPGVLYREYMLKRRGKSGQRSRCLVGKGVVANGLGLVVASTRFLKLGLLGADPLFDGGVVGKGFFYNDKCVLSGTLALLSPR